MVLVVIPRSVASLNRLQEVLSEEIEISDPHTEATIAYHPEKALKYGQYYLSDAEENTSGMLKEEKYQKILKDREENMISIREQLKDLDFCIMQGFNNILQYTALPAITIPCGLLKDGMPAGIYMTAKTDAELVHHAYAVERTVGHRVEPKSL